VIAVYGLFDPRDGALRYVGKASDPRVRLKGHLAEARFLRTHAHRWIAQLRSAGLRPELEVLEWHDTTSGANEAECFFIAYFRAIGCMLTNISHGGDGAPGYRHPPEVRAKISAFLTGRHPSAETLAKMSAAKAGVPYASGRRAPMLGRRHSAEWRTSAAIRALGRRHTDDARALMAMRMRGNTNGRGGAGRKHSLETRERIGAALRGRALMPEHRAKISAALRARSAVS
jgi:NUMOD3 motif